MNFIMWVLTSHNICQFFELQIDQLLHEKTKQVKNKIIYKPSFSILEELILYACWGGKAKNLDTSQTIDKMVKKASIVV